MPLSVLYALTHMASQIMYKWVAPPAVDDQTATTLDGLSGLPAAAELSEREWRELISWGQGPGLALVPWLKAYSFKYDPDATRLSSEAVKHFSSLKEQGGHYVTLADEAFPPLLRLVRDPPVAFSAVGELGLMRRPAISVVGSRKASALAMREGFALGRALAAFGALVVSGGAYGCDIAAHQGVLAAGLYPAPAAGVFAGGLQELYPIGNSAIFERLRRRRGLFLSERLWQAPSRPADFPVRNRIISGLSSVTVVLQAAERSGALVTARLALEEGREVAVLVHPQGDVRADGSAALILDGATSFISAEALMQRLSGQPLAMT